MQFGGLHLADFTAERGKARISFFGRDERGE